MVLVRSRKRMKVAVTGARGFVGRHVIKALAGRSVDIVGTLGPGGEHERPTLADAHLRWVALDLANHGGEDAFERLGLPMPLSTSPGAGCPTTTRCIILKWSSRGKYPTFLAGLVRAGLPALVVAGTCFEYGMCSGPLHANAETRPDNPYGIAKDTLRRQLQHLKRQVPFRFTWARLFYMYGEGQPETSLLPLLRRAVAAGETEFALSGGEQLRDYLPVEVVARGLVNHALNIGDPGPINLCSGVPISVRRLVESWIVENGWCIKLKLGALPYSVYEPMAFWGVPGAASSKAAGPFSVGE